MNPSTLTFNCSGKSFKIKIRFQKKSKTLLWIASSKSSRILMIKISKIITLLCRLKIFAEVKHSTVQLFSSEKFSTLTLLNRKLNLRIQATLSQFCKSCQRFLRKMISLIWSSEILMNILRQHPSKRLNWDHQFHLKSCINNAWEALLHMKISSKWWSAS